MEEEVIVRKRHDNNVSFKDPVSNVIDYRSLLDLETFKKSDEIVRFKNESNVEERKNENTKPSENKCSAFMTFFYNSENGNILGHTPFGLAMFALYIIILYACMIGIFLMLFYSWCFIQINGKSEPVLIGTESLLWATPGLTVVPNFGKQFSMNLKEAKDRDEAVKKITDALNNTADSKKKYPDVYKDIKQCSEAYTDLKMCLLFRLNKVVGWVPETEVSLSCAILPQATLTYVPANRQFNSTLFPYISKEDTSFTFAFVALKLDIATSNKNKEHELKCEVIGLTERKKFHLSPTKLTLKVTL